jgi:hypothetical protein
MDRSDLDRSQSFFEHDIDDDGQGGGTLVGFESPIGRQMFGGTPNLGLASGRSKLYNRQDWKHSTYQSRKFLSLVSET